MLDPFLKHVEVPPTPPDAPGPFHFAEEEQFGATLSAAGFPHVHTGTHHVAWPWRGSPEEAWEAKRELSAPFKKLIASLPADKSDEVIAAVRRFQEGDKINFPASLVIGIGIS